MSVDSAYVGEQLPAVFTYWFCLPGCPELIGYGNAA